MGINKPPAAVQALFWRQCLIKKIGWFFFFFFFFLGAWSSPMHHLHPAGRVHLYSKLVTFNSGSTLAFRRFNGCLEGGPNSTGCLQGDRRAGPSLTAFNYESRWGQLALKATYRAIMEEEGLPVMPPCCRPTLTGEPPMTLQHFLGQVSLLTFIGLISEQRCFVSFLLILLRPDQRGRFFWL